MVDLGFISKERESNVDNSNNGCSIGEDPR